MQTILHTPDLRIYDDFLESPDDTRSKGLKAKFGNKVERDGEVYKRVAEQVLPEVVDALNTAMGRPIELLGMGWRLNYEKEMPNHAIHADLGWGTYASVLYLSSPADWQHSGTAFWEHHTGHDRVKQGEASVLKDVINDWDNPLAWNQTAFVPSKFNRGIIYRSELFHSRWPFTGYGTNPDDGRLIVVSFFN